MLLLSNLACREDNPEEINGSKCSESAGQIEVTVLNNAVSADAYEAIYANSLDVIDIHDAQRFLSTLEEKFGFENSLIAASLIFDTSQSEKEVYSFENLLAILAYTDGGKVFQIDFFLHSSESALMKVPELTSKIGYLSMNTTHELVNVFFQDLNVDVVIAKAAASPIKSGSRLNELTPKLESYLQSKERSHTSR